MAQLIGAFNGMLRGFVSAFKGMLILGCIAGLGIMSLPAVRALRCFEGYSWPAKKASKRRPLV